ncbi:MAG: UDP-N-acetylmuramoyl-tripeptide--D-alanyl-D-alanine ligase [Clostridium sp.]|nr:UDP-N-acetylmuramoyl-tripeptide--D-alanyl-D-alanine ligase [Clostridium sp.]MBO6149962.1 UDP-N-acetylmuramoyl-tripeptide--D-alanyl-D-alanine ligase [Clostridium sp.]
MYQVTAKDIAEACGGTILTGNPDTVLRNISIDSRKMQGEDLFVPIIGEKNDAHRFIGQAMENGAAASLTSEHDSAPEGFPGVLIRVEHTVKALQAIGRMLRARLNIPVIGITGSVGKTSTREITALAVAAKYNTFKTPANHNSQVGVPITISEIGPEAEAAVLELGMSEPGEMSLISEIARVDIAVVTNIGVAHIENLGSRENIMKEKLHIQDGMKEGGVLIVNGDNDLLKTVLPKAGIRLIRYGTEAYNDCRAEDIRLENGYPRFTCVFGEKRVPVSLSVMGEHHILNALAAIAAADCLGVAPEDAAKALEKYTGFKGRQDITFTDGMTIIDDSYNASPDSMKAALRVLHSVTDCSRRIAVLGDMKELGPEEVRFHRDIGAAIAGLHLDLLVTYGSLAREFAKGAYAAGGFRDNLRIEAFDAPEDKEELTAFLKSELKPGDAVLFKGSNSMKLGEIAACFTRK